MSPVPRWLPLVLSLGLAMGAGIPRSAAATVLEPSEADIERARELYENGVSLFDEGSYEGAALAFERAYELSEDNNLLYNIALAYDRNGDFEQAIEYLDRYRALAPKSERDELLRKKKSLVRRLEKQQEAEANGESGDEDEGEDEGLDDELGDELSDSEADDGAEPPPKKARRFPPAAWALTATAAVGFGLGTGFGVASLGNSRRGAEGCTDAGANTFCQSSSGDAIKRSRTFAVVADVSFAVGAAATVGVVIVVALAVRKSKKAKADDVAVAPLLSPHGAGLALRRRF